MDKKEAIHSFIKQNISILCSPKATTSIIKKLRTSYFNKMRLKSGGRFSYKDICEAVIEDICTVRIGKDQIEIYNEINRIPFISDNLSDEKINEFILLHMKTTESILSKDDLHKMKDREYLDNLEKQFEEQAREKVELEMREEKKKLEDLIAETEKEKQYLQKYRSELDNLPPVIEYQDNDFQEESDTELIRETWWKRMGLVGNPFPSNDGLIGIPQEYYEHVIVRTKFVNTFLSKIENNPEDFLGQSIAIIGEYGSGKTTLLNMMCYELGTKGIIPAKIILMPSPDSGAITIDFFRQLAKEIDNATMNSYEININYNSIDSLSKLGGVVDKYKRFGGNGIIIFIDGLHKGIQFFSRTVEFLQQLQNIQEYVEQNGVRCGFLIAGSPYWDKELHGRPSMSGSITNIEAIPPLLERDAVEAVVRRIESFSQPGLAAPIINRDSIRVAFQTLRERFDYPVTFRRFISHIAERLKVGNFEEVGIEVSSHFETVKIIQDFIHSTEIGGKYSVIVKEIEKIPKLRNKLSDILPKIYQCNGVEESDSIFRNNVKIFNMLKTQGFIVKRRSPRRGPFVWSISPSVARVLRSIQNEYSIHPEDALSIFFESYLESKKREANTLYSNIIEKISESISLYQDSWPEIALKLEEIRGSLNQLEGIIVNRQYSSVDLKIVPDTCKLLLGCILEASDERCENDVENIQTLKNIWCAPENIEDIVKLCEEKEIKFDSDTKFFGYIHHHAEILTDLLLLLNELTQGEAISRIINRRLHNQDKIKIHKARLLFLNHSYKEVVDTVTRLLEEKVRDIGYSVFRAFWGPQWTKLIPKDIVEKSTDIESRGHPRIRRPPDENIFYDISRSEYGKILFQKQLRKAIFGDSIRDSDFSQMKEMWELAFSLGDREAHRDRPRFFREHATEIADVLRYLPIICENFFLIVERLLVRLKFKYEKWGKGGSSIKGIFEFHSNGTRKPYEIIINIQNGERIIKTVLSSISRNPRDAIPLNRILIVEGEPIEAQIAILNALIQRRLITISQTTRLSITPAGEEELKKLEKPKTN